MRKQNLLTKILLPIALAGLLIGCSESPSAISTCLKDSTIEGKKEISLYKQETNLDASEWPIIVVKDPQDGITRYDTRKGKIYFTDRLGEQSQKRFNPKTNQDFIRYINKF